MHAALNDPKLTPEALGHVVAATMFGDPTGRPRNGTTPVAGPIGEIVQGFPSVLSDKTIINCATGIGPGEFEYGLVGLV